jgi:hypothetical protein
MQNSLSIYMLQTKDVIQLIRNIKKGIQNVLSLSLIAQLAGHFLRPIFELIKLFGFIGVSIPLVQSFSLDPMSRTSFLADQRGTVVRKSSIVLDEHMGQILYEFYYFVYRTQGR